MKLQSPDTITAIATPTGEGAISVLRVSGPDSIGIVDRVFRGKNPLRGTPGYTIKHGAIADVNGQQIDEVLVSVFLSPNSYTGEDSVEISCHGGVFVTRKILATLIAAGARQADPGEFTKRAFLNGKLDLSQAEAVADMIRARSERALRNSKAQLGGSLGGAVRALKNDLLQLVSLLELQLDFSNEDVPIASSNIIRTRIGACKERLEGMLSSFHLGKIVRDGASVAIIGEPNVGKSSLFNRLLMEERSIVSHTPGTTRDFLEESIEVDGLQVRITDTAGLRTANDEIEAEGISRTKAVIGAADIILIVEDATNQRDQFGGVEPSSLCALTEAKTIRVLNKVDLTRTAQNWTPDRVRVSALTGEGIDELRQTIGKLLVGDTAAPDSDLYICSSRHREALAMSLRCLGEAMKSVESKVPTEFIASDLRLSLDSLSLITGEVTTDEILDSIFSNFCIGK